MVLQILENFLNHNVEAAPEMEDSFKSAWKFMELGLRDGVRELVQCFHKVRPPSPA